MVPRPGYHHSVLWPDRQTGPFTVHLRLARIGDRYEAVEIAISSLWDHRPVTGTDLRGIRVGELTAEAATFDAPTPTDELLGAVIGGEFTPAGEFTDEFRESREATLKAVAAGQDQDRRRRSRATRELQRVADVYKKARHERRPPTKAVMEDLGLPTYAAAASRVYRARQAGLLDPTTAGSSAGVNRRRRRTR